jgi:hypothetical protein
MHGYSLAVNARPSPRRRQFYASLTLQTYQHPKKFQRHVLRPIQPLGTGIIPHAGDLSIKGSVPALVTALVSVWSRHLQNINL